MLPRDNAWRILKDTPLFPSVRWYYLGRTDREHEVNNNSRTDIKQWRTQEFFFWGGSTNSVEDRGQRGRGSGGGSPIVRGSGGSCNLVQKFISYSEIFLIFGALDYL